MTRVAKQPRSSASFEAWSSSVPPKKLRSSRAAISVFQTDLGWFGLLGVDGQLSSVFIGHSSATSVVQRATDLESSAEQADWTPDLRQHLEAYSEGEIIDFSQIALRLPEMTTFRQQIVAATRGLRYGEIVSYGELATRAGHPGAARAVGTVMSTNRFPIVIPCHRVIAAGGKLGGFTSPSGTDLKERMLDLEARALGVSRTRLLWPRTH